MPNPSTQPVSQSTEDGLIPVFEGAIGGVACSVCDARTLHTFLESKYQFQDWIKARIKKYEFIENQDFALVSENSEIKTGRGGDRRSVVYHLTLDMAKELSMVENNEKGRQARRYFIDCERRAQGSLTGNSRPDLPPMIEDAIEFRAWRLANDYRSTTMSLLGESTPSDQEVLWDMAYRVKKHARANLAKQAMQLLSRKMDIQAISAWIMAWHPEGWRCNAQVARG